MRRLFAGGAIGGVLGIICLISDPLLLVTVDSLDALLGIEIVVVTEGGGGRMAALASIPMAGRHVRFSTSLTGGGLPDDEALLLSSGAIASV